MDDFISAPSAGYERSAAWPILVYIISIIERYPTGIKVVTA
jgi:hypothetical protein